MPKTAKVQEPEIELFDDDEASDYYGIELNDGLLPREIEEAARLVRYTKGIMLDVGMPGQGKGLFANVLGYKIKKYYKERHAVRDDRPRSLFGQYTPFNEQFILKEVAKMEKVARGEVPKEIARNNHKLLKEVEEQMTKWRTTEGEVILQHSVSMFDEFWRYFHNRRPHNPMGILLGGVLKTWRHLDCLVLGIAQQASELDRFSCLPFITHEARCSWSLTRPNTAECNIYTCRYVGSRGVLEVGAKKPTKVWVDGGKQRPELGIYMIQNPNGMRLAKIEKDIVDIVQENSLITLYNLAELLEDDPQEVEGAVWHLVSKDILRCKRYFDLYNSKSAVALRPKVSFKM